MAIIQHSAVTGSNLHGVVAFTFATAVARDAQAVVASDIGKVARITADNSFYVLTGNSPVVWSPVTGALATVATSGSYVDLTNKPAIVASSTVNTWSAGQRGAVTALTPGSTVTPDFAASNNFSLAPTQSFTLANPTNVVAGQSGIIAVTQDATGSRVLTLGANYKKAGGTAIVLTTAANAVDYVTYYVESPTRIFVSLIADVK